MLSAQIDQALTLIEAQCEAVAEAVASGEPLTLQAASNQLKQSAVDFAGLLRQLDQPGQAGAELQARVQKLAVRLAAQREGLLRRTVVVERAVQTLVPAARKATYTQSGRAGGFQTYAS